MKTATILGITLFYTRTSPKQNPIAQELNTMNVISSNYYKWQVSIQPPHLLAQNM